MPRKKYNIIIPLEIYPRPSEKEISAAYLLADFFQTDIEFIPRKNQKTADFLISGKNWELKSPTGDGERNIQHTISRALKQSQYIIIDARYSKVNLLKIKSKINAEIKINKQIKRLLLITKSSKIIEFSR